MSIDLDRITHPLRLAKGSHEPGSGKGCAMNVISYINGDTMITDYPECSARPLARLVQGVNDMLAGTDGYLSPENSALVLDLGWATVGTAGVSDSVKWQWMSDLLVHPERGVIKHARPDGVGAIRRVADLLASKAGGAAVSLDEWRAAREAAYTARRAAYAAADAAAYAAAYAAADAAAYAVADAAADAAAAAYADADAARRTARIDFARWAIQHWRDLAGLDQQNDIDAAAVDSALARIGN